MTDDPVADFCDGRISAEVALARLLLTGGDPAVHVANVEPLRHLLERHAAAVGRMRKMLGSVDHASAADVRRIAEMFDEAVAVAPEASVALYSLGDPATLERATAELVEWLVSARLVGPKCDVLDLGCGIGRVARALAPLCRTVLGIDVSVGMISAARSEPAPGNLRFALTGGEGLAGLGPFRTVMPGLDPGIYPTRRGCGWIAGSSPAMTDSKMRFGQTFGSSAHHAAKTPCSERFGTILAVDAMPYLVQAGVADEHIRDAARLLRPGGSLVVLNLSYCGIEQDRATAATWATAYGFSLTNDAEKPFSLWDGTAFVFRR